jgi:hypothetical protein
MKQDDYDVIRDTKRVNGKNRGKKTRHAQKKARHAFLKSIKK